MKLALNTLRQAGSGTITARYARHLLAAGGQLVDVRSPDDFRKGTLSGARNLPIDALSWDHRYLDKTEPVIVYGSQDACCVRAARLLAGKGFSRIYHLAGRGA